MLHKLLFSKSSPHLGRRRCARQMRRCVKSFDSGAPAQRIFLTVRLGSGSARRAVDRAAGSARAGKIQSQVMESANSAIRARPMATVPRALVIGYLLGRLWDLGPRLSYCLGSLLGIA